MTILNETTLTNGVSIPKPGAGTWLIQRRQEPRMRGSASASAAIPRATARIYVR